jgi:CRISPR-associated protein Cas2
MSGRLRHLIVAYDVETLTAEGRRRLRKLAQACCAHGVRVQKSLFECALEVPETVRFTARLIRIVDTEADSLRIYDLGATGPSVQIYGKDAPLGPRKPWII